jgi:cytochrome c oxidase subunit 1
LIATAFAGFGLWVHHMFTVGLPKLGQSFFTAASMLIAIPSGTQIFCWIATVWTGRPRLTTPMLFLLGFVFTFVLGGLTGVMQASVPLNMQVHDTYFVVAHFHYVLIGGAVFPLFGAFYYWFPKAYGRLLSEHLGQWNFALLFLGFNITFFPLHILGLQGMPRRVYTYSADTGWADLNLLASLGAVVLTAGVVLFLLNVIASLRRPIDAPDNPWGAEGLEWATSSPPPPYNFADLPVVRGRYALWTPGETTVVTGLRHDKPMTLVTHVLDAQPDHKMEMPEPTIWPLLSALAVTGLFVGSIFTPWAIVWGSIPTFIALVGWFWPKRGEECTRRHVRSM